MYPLLISILLLVAPQFAVAYNFTSEVHSIDFGVGSEPHLVRFESGRVSFVAPSEVALIDSLILGIEKNETITVSVNEKNELLAAQTVYPDDVEDQCDDEVRATNYKPSVLTTYNLALTIFNRMNGNYTEEGQCYNRAHIWAYEEYRRSKLHSMKIFMFFTESYIRKYNFHWWFHVTPMVYVWNLNSPRTLDRRYTAGVRQTKTWSDVFVKSKRTCPIVRNFNDFWLNQQKEDCYHIYSSMYYVIPRDLEKRDLTGIEKTEFKEKEIRKAYLDAF